MYLDTVALHDGSTRSFENPSKHLHMSLTSGSHETEDFLDEYQPSSAKSNPKKLKTQVKSKLLRCIIPPIFLQILVAFLPVVGYLAVFINYTQIRHLFNLDPIVSRAANKTILQNAELALLGFLPHKLLGQYHHIVFDFMAAIPYLFHFVLPFVYILYTFVTVSPKKRSQVIIKYIWVYGWVCFIAALTQLFFPTSPPWFNDTAKFDPVTGALLTVGSSEAAFSRIDAVLPYPLFHSIYSQSKVQFGAFPSLHCAWPAVILFYKPWFSYKVALVHLLWIMWAAMYTGHHYFVDTLGGTLLSAVVVFLNSDSSMLKKVPSLVCKLIGLRTVRSSESRMEEGIELRKNSTTSLH